MQASMTASSEAMGGGEEKLLNRYQMTDSYRSGQRKNLRDIDEHQEYNQKAIWKQFTAKKHS